MNAEPLLMVCGIASDADSWRDQAGALGGRAIVPEGETIDAMASRLLEDAPPRFALAGHSMGGYVALAAVLMAPERVTRLALVNTSAAPDGEEQRRTRARTIAAIESRGLSSLLTGLPRMLTDDPEVQERAAAMLIRAGASRVVREHRACATRPDRRPSLRSIQVPTCIVGTQDDAIVLVAAAHEMAGLIPGADLAILETGGHVSPMTRPSQVTALLQQWLTRLKNG